MEITMVEGHYTRRNCIKALGRLRTIDLEGLDQVSVLFPGPQVKPGEHSRELFWYKLRKQHCKPKLRGLLQLANSTPSADTIPL